MSAAPIPTPMRVGFHVPPQPGEGGGTSFPLETPSVRHWSQC